MQKVRFEKLIYNFYFVLRLEGHSYTCPNPRRLEYFYQKLTETKEKLMSVMYDSLVDYLWLTVIGEARHAKAHSSADVFIDGLGAGDRRIAYEYGRRCRFCNENLQALLTVFRENKWEENYGGSAWARIVEVLMNRQKTILWIDHAIDLCHNTGTVFNKPVIYDYSEYMSPADILGLKRYYDVIDDRESFKGTSLWLENYTLLQMASNLGLEVDLDKFKWSDSIPNYVPVRNEREGHIFKLVWNKDNKVGIEDIDDDEDDRLAEHDSYNATPCVARSASAGQMFLFGRKP